MTGKRALSVIERDSRIMITTTRQPYPFVAQRGDKDYAYDIEGKRYIDFTSFVSVYNFGVNSVSSARQAIKKQVDTLMHAAFTDFYSELPVTFAERLVRFFPKGFGRVFFSNSGTEANEAALKFSRIFTKRTYHLAFYNAFHGRTMGSLSLTASRGVQREHYGPFGAALHAPFAYCYRCPFGQEYPSCGIACADYIRKYPLSKEVTTGEVAAIFVEPVQGEGGYIVPPPEFIKELRKMASENNILLVSDEVQSGYMRTGTFLALDNFKVDADIYTMAKSIGAGLPMGVTISRRSLGDIPEGSHSNTFGGNLAAIAGANASLEYLSKNKRSLRSMVYRKHAYMVKRLEELKERYEIVGDVRALGMMIGIELVKNKESKEPAINARDKVLRLCFERGLLLLPAGISSIRLIPPITISEASMKKGMDIFEEAVRIADSGTKRSYM